jgi:hypothetical protein
MQFQPPVGPEHVPQKGLFNAAERKRFLMLSVLLVISLGMFLYGFLSRKARPSEAPEAPAAVPEVEVEVATPEVDLAALAAATRDASEAERVLVETAALEQLLETCRLIAPTHFEPMGGRVLDAALAAAVLADPPAHRGALLRAFGTIEAIDAFDAPGTTAHYRGRLALEGGGAAWFAVRSLSEDWGEVGEFVRIDGLFLKVYRGQAGGAWIDAPWIVGARAERAYPRLEPVAELDPALFADIEDDGSEGLTGLPFEAYWALVAYARDVPEGAIDWESAPLFDKDLAAELSERGADLRGVPLRLPPSEILDIWHQAQPANPLRAERLVEGWASNWNWVKGPSPVIRFITPLDTTELRRGDHFTARGFFLKNLAYEPRDGGMAVAPFFVLHSIDAHTPSKKNPWVKVFGTMAVGLLVVVCLAYVALMRDQRKARELQGELARRRLARRSQPLKP